MKQNPFFQNAVIITGASTGIGRELGLSGLPDAALVYALPPETKKS